MERLTAQQVYNKLVEGYGKPRWWPGTPYEIMTSAILVQNTAWTQVEKVFAAWGEPEPARVLEMPVEQLQETIRPCGFMKAKAATIRRVSEWYRGYGFDIEKARAANLDRLRQELLGLKGIGAETADAMLVFALQSRRSSSTLTRAASLTAWGMGSRMTDRSAASSNPDCPPITRSMAGTTGCCLNMARTTAASSQRAKAACSAKCAPDGLSNLPHRHPTVHPPKTEDTTPQNDHPTSIFGNT